MNLNAIYRKVSGQSAAGVIIAVFVAVLIGAVLIAPVQTSINTVKTTAGTVGGGGALNTTVDNVPLLFGVLLLVVTVGGMLSVVQ